MMKDFHYSLIIPVYKNEGTIEPLIEALTGINAALEKPFEAVFVVDGSPDASYSLLKRYLPSAPFSSQVACLSRNFGSFAAIRMGLEIARGRYFAVMAADLQEPPELAVKFFNTLAVEPIDIAIGVRTKRHDPFFSTLAANLFWWAYRHLIQPDMPPGGVDIFACNRQVRDALLKLTESHSTLIGLIFWLGFRRKEIPYVRRARLAGESGWSFRRRLRYLLDSSYAFTDLPVIVLMFVGGIGFASSLVVGLVVFVAWLNDAIQVRGYTPLVILICAFSSMIILAQGVVGAYVWRAYENTKQRPLYVPMLQESFDVADQL